MRSTNRILDLTYQNLRSTYSNQEEEEIRTEDGVDRVHGDLVLSGITDEPLGVSEGDVRRRGPVTLIISDDLNAVVLPHSDARVRRTEVDTDRWTFSFTRHSNNREE